MANMIDKQQRNAHVLKAYDIANPGSVYIPSQLERGKSRLDEDELPTVPEKVERVESQFEQEAKNTIVQLRQEQRDSVGIRDDESILCHTPPANEEPTKFQIVQPINLTFNVN